MVGRSEPAETREPAAVPNPRASPGTCQARVDAELLRRRSRGCPDMACRRARRRNSLSLRAITSLDRLVLANSTSALRKGSSGHRCGSLWKVLRLAMRGGPFGSSREQWLAGQLGRDASLEALRRARAVAAAPSGVGHGDLTGSWVRLVGSSPAGSPVLGRHARTTTSHGGSEAQCANPAHRRSVTILPCYADGRGWCLEPRF